jgi:hypothetical protein
LAVGKGSSGAAGSPRALGGHGASEWEVTSERVLGQKLDLWQVRAMRCMRHFSRGSQHRPLVSAIVARLLVQACKLVSASFCVKPAYVFFLPS